MNNAFLNSLPDDIARLLRPNLEWKAFAPHEVIFGVDEKLKEVIFPTSGIVSLFVNRASNRMVQAACIGRDGAIGLSEAITQTQTAFGAKADLQVAAVACDAAIFQQLAAKSPALLGAVIRQQQMIDGQLFQAAACLSAHEVMPRLARFLLRTSDVTGSMIFSYTHEQIAESLGTRRSTVTVASNSLVENGFIRHRRGRLEVINVDGLRKVSCTCHEHEKVRLDTLNFSKAESNGGHSASTGRVAALSTAHVFAK